jgi:adenylyl- and sulfurtransferase ThiI
MSGTAQGIISLFRAEAARQQVLLQSLTQELSDVPNIESAHQVETMDFDRPDADIQCRADLAIGMTQRDQSKNLALTGRNMQRRFGAVSHPMERECGDVFASGHLSSSGNV